MFKSQPCSCPAPSIRIPAPWPARSAQGAPADAIASFNGNRQQSNSYILDGVDINETLQSGIGYNPSPFSIQEVHVITGNADAEFGNVNGGEVVMVTKGGTNQFHGSVFGFHEGGGLTANTWSNKYSQVTRSGYTQNQYGAAAGGPIFKNKLFFFGNYEGLRYSTSGPKAASVATSAMRGIAACRPLGNALDPGSACANGYADFSAIANPSTDDTILWDTTNGYNNETPYPGPTPGTYNCIPINPNNEIGRA